MATRYWVGGAGTWDSSTTANWSATSGGAGGASAPTSVDDVVFDSASNATSYAVTLAAGAACASINMAGPASGTVSTSGAVNNSPSIYGGMTLAATGVTWGATGTIQFLAASGSWTITTNGVSIPLTYIGPGTASTATWALGSALTISTAGGSTSVRSGTFDTAGYNYTAPVTPSTPGNANLKTIYLRSSTLTCSSATPIGLAVDPNLTWDAGTSQINLTSTAAAFNGYGLTFYNVSFTTTASSTPTISGSNTFNNLSFAARAAIGVSTISVSANQTVNGTFTIPTAVNAAARFRIQSATVGTSVTLTAAAVVLNDVDFVSITGAGAATWSGTRLGDVGNNSGITFPAAKTVYWSTTTTTALGISVAYWATSSGGSTTNGATTNWPLAQDTCIFDNNSCGTGGTPGFTLNLSYSLGSFDFSALTKTYNFGCSSNVIIVGDIKLSSTSTTSFSAGSIIIRGYGVTQKLTTAGVTWTAPLTINAVASTFQLQDNLTLGSTATITHNYGTFDANGKNVTSASTFTSNSGNTRTLSLGSGTWAFSGSGAVWTVTSTGLTLNQSTSTLSFTSASAKTFAGGGVSYRTLNQGGAGTLTITGANTFYNITNSVQPTTITFPASITTTVSNFGVSGTAGNLVTINSSTPGTQFNLAYLP